MAFSRASRIFKWVVVTACFDKAKTLCFVCSAGIQIMLAFIHGGGDEIVGGYTA